MKYENINDISKLKQIHQDKLKQIQREQSDIEQIELRIKQINYEKDYQLKMTI